MAKITEITLGPDDPIFSEGVTLFSPKIPVKPIATNPKLNKTESGVTQVIFFSQKPTVGILTKKTRKRLVTRYNLNMSQDDNLAIKPDTKSFDIINEVVFGKLLDLEISNAEGDLGKEVIALRHRILIVHGLIEWALASEIAVKIQMQKVIPTVWSNKELDKDMMQLADLVFNKLRMKKFSQLIELASLLEAVEANTLGKFGRLNEARNILVHTRSREFKKYQQQNERVKLMGLATECLNLTKHSELLKEYVHKKYPDMPLDKFK